MLVGLIFSVLILIGNVLRLLNKKLVEQKWFSVVIAFLSVIILISGVVLFVGADGHIAITTIEACGTSEIFRGAGSYMYLIFPAVIFIVAILEIFCTFNKSSKERGWNENI